MGRGGFDFGGQEIAIPPGIAAIGDVSRHFGCRGGAGRPCEFRANDHLGRECFIVGSGQYEGIVRGDQSRVPLDPGHDLRTAGRSAKREEQAGQNMDSGRKTRRPC